MKLCLFDLPDELIELILNCLDIEDMLKSRLISKPIRQIIDKEKIIEKKKQFILDNLNLKNIVDRRNFSDKKLILINNQYNFENAKNQYFSESLIRLIVLNDNKLILTFFENEYQFNDDRYQGIFEIELKNDYYKLYINNAVSCMLILSDRMYYFESQFDKNVKNDYIYIYQHKYRYNLQSIFMNGTADKYDKLHILYPNEVIYFEDIDDEITILSGPVEYFSENMLIYTGYNYGKLIVFIEEFDAIYTMFCQTGNGKYRDPIWTCYLDALETKLNKEDDEFTSACKKIIEKLNSKKYKKCQKYIDLIIYQYGELLYEEEMIF